jgi:hypothetical protein
LVGNAAQFGGGAAGATLESCTLRGNQAADAGGGALDGSLSNCLLTGNMANERTGSGGGAHGSYLNNCTLFGNAAKFGGGAANARLNNCIIYSNNVANYSDSTLNYCCTTPQPENGIGNITLPPLFIDGAGGNLQPGSPCINAGNNAFAFGATDLQGKPRIAGETIDIGAYEFQSPASLISYAWLKSSTCPRTAPLIAAIVTPMA